MSKRERLEKDREDMSLMMLIKYVGLDDVVDVD